MTDWTGMPTIYGYCKRCGTATSESCRYCTSCQQIPEVGVLVGRHCVTCKKTATVRCAVCRLGLCDEDAKKPDPLYVLCPSCYEQEMTLRNNKQQQRLRRQQTGLKKRLSGKSLVPAFQRWLEERKL